MQVITGSGRKVGSTLVNHPDVAGITFTGSYDVGMGIYKGFASDYPKPTVCEMGGKNPVIVTASADLDLAADRGDARRIRLQRPEMLGELAGVRRKAGLRRLRRSSGRAGQRRSRSATRSRTGSSWVRSSIGARWSASRRRLTEVKDSGGEVLAGGEVITEGDLEPRQLRRTNRRHCAETSWVWDTELFLALRLGDAGRLSRRSDHPRQ